MPYNPSTGVYTLPAIYLAIPGTTIIAAQHNEPLVDLQTANNYARPIVAGGTGASTAATARTELAVPGLADVNIFTKRNAWAKGANIVSALAITVGTDGNFFHITGSNTITSFSSVSAGCRILLEFTGALTLTHSANIILPGATSIITSPGDMIELVSEGSGVWRCVSYTPNNVVYSNGIYTPVLVLGGASVGMAGTFLGNWTRIGNIIVFNALITLTNKGSSTGDAAITVPFLQNSNYAYACSGSNFTGLTAGVVAQGAAATAGALMRANTTTGTRQMDNTDFTNTTSFIVSGAYVRT